MVCRKRSNQKHAYKDTVVAATCTEKGYTLHKCSTCGESYKDNYKAALGHSYTSKVTKAATCTENRVKTYTCSRCNNTYTETIEKTGHKYVDTVVAPTNTEKGYTLHKCSVCGDSYKDNYTDCLDPTLKTYSNEMRNKAAYVSAGDKIQFVMADTAYNAKWELVIDDEETSITPGEIINITSDYEGKSVVFRAARSSGYVGFECNIVVGTLDKNSGFFYSKNADDTATIFNYLGNDADKIKTLTVPAQVAGIKVTGVHSSFDKCTALEELIYSEGITKIDIQSNNFMSSLNTDEWSHPSNKIVFPSTFTEGSIFEYMNTPELVFDGTEVIPANLCNSISKIKKVTFKSGVKTIKEAAFCNCQGITDIDWCDTITTIEDYAFSRNALTTLKLPDSVQSIGKEAFSYSKFENAILSSKLSEIGEKAFVSCEALKSVDLKSVKSIGEFAFNECSQLENITFPDTLTDIAEYAFAGCSSLEINALPENVTVYNKGVFENCKALTVSAIPEGVTQIYSDAFSNCQFKDEITLPVTIQRAAGLNGVKKLILKEGVTELTHDIFAGCDKLTEVVLPESLTKIGNRVFEGCNSLKEITIPKNVNECPGAMATLGSAFEFSSIETVTFEEGTEKVHNALFANCGSLKQINLPSTVNTIGKYAFYYCTGLEKVDLPEGVTSLETSCFAYCDKLNYICIPASVESAGGAISGAAFERCGLETVEFTGKREEIPSSMFYDCNSLKTVILPSTLKSIGNTAFYSCDELSSITFPDGLERIGDGAFSDCYKLNEVTIPASVTYLGSEGASGLGSAFGSSGLTTVHLEDGRTEIPGYAFANCRNLTNINIPSTVTGIGNYSFWHCESLENIELPSGLTSIGMGAFACTFSLSSIVLPKSVIKYGWVVGTGPFEGSGLKEVTLENGTASIAEGLFMNCNNLTTINIPSSVKLINNYAFYGCSALTSFTIPSTVEEMGYQVFYDSGVTEITIPKTIKRLGSDSMSTFEGSNITKITLEEGIETIDTAEFALAKKLVQINMPSTLKSIANSAFQECASLTTVNIPDGVTQISAYAFSDCESLESVVIPASVTQIGDSIFKHFKIQAEYPTIITTSGSTAESYAKSNGYNCTIR